MPTVKYDDRSYIVDDQRVWLASGTIHYFRVPHQLWRDRLLKAKRAGLNCIETYVAWNFHEEQPGVWNFQGDRDIREFVTIAKELGLYVILRPGPYICAEWDFGGFPAWLAVKSGIAYRTSNAVYMHYFDKYLAAVLPRLADLQVTRGGNIILIQNENEYGWTTMPDRLNYCQFISQLFRRAGFDIPIITCNWLSEPKIPETVECWNGWGNEVAGLKKLRLKQPDAPLLATEFWPGWFDSWGSPHNSKDPRETARRALEAIGCGCQVNYYMWHGGTNFAFWGSRLVAGDATYQTTSYDYDAPLAEGGGLTRKFYLTKLVNTLASRFGYVLAQAKLEGHPVTVHDGTQVLNLAGPAGRMAVITNNGRDDIKSARITLPDGTPLEVSLELFGATAVPVDVRLGPDHTLDYANLMPLGIFGEGTLVLHGPGGWESRVSIDGRELKTTVPPGEPAVLEHRGQRLIVMNSDQAMRTWDVNGTLVIGPAYVGETIEDVTPAPGTVQTVIVAPDGTVARRKPRSASTRLPAAPKLGQITRQRVCDDPFNADLAWEKLDRPKDLAALGVNYGYCWYRLEVQHEREFKQGIFLPECEDRAHIYLNGHRIGIWGRGPGAVRQPIPATFKSGPNTLVFLVDNLGRLNYGANLGSPKGLYGHVWEAKPLRLGNFKLAPDAEFSRRMVPRMMTHMIQALEAGPIWSAEVTFTLPTIYPLHLSYTNLPHDCIVLCNGRQAGFFPNFGGYGQVTLGNELKKGRNVLKLLLRGDVKLASLDNVQMHMLTESISAGGNWSFRKWELPAGEGRVVGKDLPAWYHCRFKYNSTPVPLFLRINGAKKGQIYLNGHNVGRFWNIGPQDYYYLPEPYLAEENELLIFEEHGLIPAGMRLEFRPLGPYHEVV